MGAYDTRAVRVPTWARRAALFAALVAGGVVTGSCDTGRAIVDGSCSPGCGGGQACVMGACVGTGPLRVTLVWDTPGDLDLYVRTPGGAEVSFAQRSGGGATLDRDDREMTGPENVYWSAAPPPGDYLLCVVPFAITAPTTYVLSVTRPGQATVVFRGERTMSAGRVACDDSSAFRAGAFTIE